MNTRIQQTLSVTGLLLVGAAGGIFGAKTFAPQWLAPAAASASSSTSGNTVSTQVMPGVTFKPPTTHPTSSSAAAGKVAPATKPAATTALAKPDEQSQARSLANLLMICRSQLELYKLQHHDKLPEFSRHIWDQLTLATRGDG